MEKESQGYKGTSNPVQKTSFLMNKTRGQHFLENPNIIRQIVEKASIRPTDVILEIGPGNGNMTQIMLEQASKVVAIEVDTRMVGELIKRFSPGSPLGRKMELLQGDAMKTKWPFFDMCVSNLPYQISSPVIFKLLAHRPTFRCAVLMVQEEFALRLVAKPGTDMYCRLSANVQLLAKCDHLMKVSKKNFRPPPKVESAIVRIEPRNPVPEVNFIEWDGLLRICFSRKNKTLGAIFKQKSIVKLLYENYRKIVLKETVEEEAKKGPVLEDDDRDMENEMEEVFHPKKILKNKSGTSEIQFKELLFRVLEESQFKAKRSKSLKTVDFLELLAVFNTNNIHFK